MTIDELVEKVKEFEGFSSKPYLDPGGTLTIGYGRTNAVKLGDVTTPEKESVWLKEIFGTILKKVTETMSTYNLTSDQLLALTDFTYNLGQSNLLLLIDHGNRTVTEISEKIVEYDKCRGVRLAGLTKRRRWEYELFTGKPFPTIEYRAKVIQSYANDYLRKNNSPISIEVDGIIGEKTLKALQECFNLMEGVNT